MGNRFSDPIVSISFPIIAFLAFPLLTPPAGQSATNSPQPGEIPDLNGVWSASFTPYGVKRFKNVDEADDPLTQCLPIGPARGIQAGIMPFQIVQTPSVLAILFENQRIFRIIYTEPPQRP